MRRETRSARFCGLLANLAPAALLTSNTVWLAPIGLLLAALLAGAIAVGWYLIRHRRPGPSSAAHRTSGRASVRTSRPTSRPTARPVARGAELRTRHEPVLDVPARLRASAGSDRARSAGLVAAPRRPSSSAGGIQTGLKAPEAPKSPAGSQHPPGPRAAHDPDRVWHMLAHVRSGAHLDVGEEPEAPPSREAPVLDEHAVTLRDTASLRPGKEHRTPGASSGDGGRTLPLEISAVVKTLPSLPASPSQPGRVDMLVAKAMAHQSGMEGGPFVAHVARNLTKDATDSKGSGVKRVQPRSALDKLRNARAEQPPGPAEAPSLPLPVLTDFPSATVVPLKTSSSSPRLSGTPQPSTTGESRNSAWSTDTTVPGLRPLPLLNDSDITRPMVFGGSGGARRDASAAAAPPQGIESRPRPTRWYAPNEVVVVAGRTLPGMVYVGDATDSQRTDPDPALIDPALDVAAPSASFDGLSTAGLSYASLAPAHRGAYLKWLSDGRKSTAPVGFALIFFMGLERRVFECHENPGALPELIRLATEMRRLVSSHGTHSFSLHHHASRLAALVEMQSMREKMYVLAVPLLHRTYDLPVELRLALGQAAKDGLPLPAAWALAWLLMDQTFNLRAPMTRCPNEFRQLFEVRYGQRFGNGLLLPSQGRSLSLSYMPVSQSLAHGNSLQFRIDSASEIDANCEAAQDLREVCGQCADELSEYSRYVSRNPAAAGTLEGESRLPAAIRPARPAVRASS